MNCDRNEVKCVLTHDVGSHRPPIAVPFGRSENTSSRRPFSFAVMEAVLLESVPLHQNQTSHGSEYVSSATTSPLILSFMQRSQASGLLAKWIHMCFCKCSHRRLSGHTPETLEVNRSLGEKVCFVLFSLFFWRIWMARITPISKSYRQHFTFRMFYRVEHILFVKANTGSHSDCWEGDGARPHTGRERPHDRFTIQEVMIQIHTSYRR